MLFLLDTNAITDMIHAEPRFMDRLNSLSVGDEVGICTITRGEALFGIESMPIGKRRSELKKKVDEALSGLFCHAVPPEASDWYARIKRGCERKGTPLDENDLWIAATALALGATLVTRDTDLQRVEGLSVVDWTK